MMLWKCCTQYASKFGELISGYRAGKAQFSFQSQRRAMPKNVQATTQLHPCSKFSMPGFNSMWTMSFQMYKLVLKKADEPEIKLLTSTRSSKKQESSRKTCTSALTRPKLLTVWITTNYGKFQTTRPACWEICMQVRKQLLELDMEKQTGSK